MSGGTPDAELSATCDVCDQALVALPGGGRGCPACETRACPPPRVPEESATEVAGLGDGDTSDTSALFLRRTPEESPTENIEDPVTYYARQASAPALSAVGPYELKRQIGKGGMGVVYEAWDTTHQRPVAIKLLRVRGNEASRRQLARFGREAASMRKLDHPAIVPVLDAGSHEGLPWYAMPLIDGSDLAELLRRSGPLPEKRAARLLRPIVSGLEHAHRAGIIHRDVKPQNILVRRRDGQPLLLDFGLAQDAEDSTLTRTGAVLGTPAYMSPEQVRGRSHDVDERTDVWGVGVVLYELLTGAPPFRGKTREEIRERVRQGACEPPRRLNPELSRDIEAICLRALAVEPDDRYPDMGELRIDLDRLLQGGSVDARPSVWQEVASSLRRPRLRARLALGALVLVLLLVGWREWRALDAPLERAWEALAVGDAEALQIARTLLEERAPEHPALAVLRSGGALAVRDRAAALATAESLAVAIDASFAQAEERFFAARQQLGVVAEVNRAACERSLARGILDCAALERALAGALPGAAEKQRLRGEGLIRRAVHRVWLGLNRCDRPSQELWRERLLALGGDELPGLRPGTLTLTLGEGVSVHLYRVPDQNSPPLLCAPDGAPVESLEWSELPSASASVHLEQEALFAELEEAIAAARPERARGLAEELEGISLGYGDGRSRRFLMRALLAQLEIAGEELDEDPVEWVGSAGLPVSLFDSEELFGVILRVDGELLGETLGHGEEPAFPARREVVGGAELSVCAEDGRLRRISYDPERHDFTTVGFFQNPLEEPATAELRFAAGSHALPPGSYILHARFRGRPPLQLPFLLISGETHAIALDEAVWSATPEGYAYLAAGPGLHEALAYRHGPPLLPPAAWRRELPALRIALSAVDPWELAEFITESGAPGRLFVCAEEGHRRAEGPFDSPIFVEQELIAAWCRALERRHPGLRFRRATAAELRRARRGPENAADRENLLSPYHADLGHNGGAVVWGPDHHVLPRDRVVDPREVWLVAEER